MGLVISLKMVSLSLTSTVTVTVIDIKTYIPHLPLLFIGVTSKNGRAEVQ